MRTRGARDLKKRKRRSDRKHKYVRRHGHMVPYRTKRHRGDPIKIYFWKVEPMSKEGYRNWSRDMRPRIKRVVYKPVIRVDVAPERISSKEAIEELSLDVIGYTGNFVMRGFSHGKNKYRVKQCRLCKVDIFNAPDGLKARCYDNFRLSRYWFWQKG
jgi:hypothetical protein